MSNESLDYNKIDYADSEILSYSNDIYTLTLLLRCWNDELLEIKFLKCASVFAMCYADIAEFKEVLESPLLERALDEIFEKRPIKHDFRVFKFLTSDDTTALEVVCEGINITKINVHEGDLRPRRFFK